MKRLEKGPARRKNKVRHHEGNADKRIKQPLGNKGNNFFPQASDKLAGSSGLRICFWDPLFSHDGGHCPLSDPDLGGPVSFRVHETGILPDENQGDRSRWTIPVLGDNGFGNIVLFFGVR